MSAPAPAPIPALLEFLDSWTFLATKDVTFDKVFQPNQEETMGLELLRNLESLRRNTAGKQTTGALDAAQLDKMLQYCQELEALVAKVEPEGTPTGLITQWTSPLAGRPSYYHKLTGLACEMGMATFQYGSALRAAAVQLLASAASASATATTSPPGSPEQAGAASGATAAAEASTLLRKAAGVFQWLQERGLVRVAMQLPQDRPAEMVMSMSKVMSQVCLAEAQMVAAVRAEQRGVSTGLVAALHAAAWEMWENAAKTLKISTGDYVSLSDHLRRYLASSAAVCRARALRSMAQDLRVNKEEAGQAEAACVFAASLLSAAHVAADVNASWRQVASLEAAALEETRIKCQKDRENVYYQQVARTPPDLPPGKVLVTPIAFQLSAPAAAASAPGSQPAAGVDAGGAVPGEGQPAQAGAGASSTTAVVSALEHSLTLRGK